MAKKKLITIGCSFTKDNYQLTWADYLADKLNMTLENIGARGAGIDFLSKRLIYHTTKNSCDLVAIMLPSIDRFDWYIDNSHPLLKNAVKISSWQNGQNSSLIKINGELSDDSGYCLSGGEIRGDKKFWYKFYYNESSMLLNYWKTVYDIQNYLNHKKIKYFISMAYDRDFLVEQKENITGSDDSHLFFFSIIDWSKFIFYENNRGFLSYVKDKNFRQEKNHPVSESHKSWTDEILLPAIKIL